MRVIVTPETNYVTRNEFYAYLACIACGQKNMGNYEKKNREKSHCYTKPIIKTFHSRQYINTEMVSYWINQTIWTKLKPIMK